jgi:glutathione synthase/RimK-type ligase-like ATP-grasp enzyme/Flp pilus assembly protein TadD
MKANRGTAVRSAKAADEGGWAPRLAQEARLAELDVLLAKVPDDSIRIEVERAALLGALNRREAAQQAFVSILKRAPTHFSALNEFGTLLTNMGAIDAACRVYAEAILHHPDHPMARVNLANLLLRATRYEEARGHYERALQADPDHAAAHQGMGAVLADLGDRDGARAHFSKGFGGHAVSALPYRGDKPPIKLLQLVSSGGGNIPSALFLDEAIFQTTVVVADYLDDATALPPHQLIFNAIGDADLCEPALNAATRIAAGARVPVINDPRAVMKTGRIDNAKRLRALPGVRTARTAAMPRKVLASADGVSLLEAQGFRFPLLLRSPGYHTGRNVVLVEAAADLAAAAQSLPGEELLAIEYLDARGPDGQARKYRVMMIGGRLYPLHLAISKNWKVHYFTADMAEHADYRAEEAKFLEDMPAVLGSKAIRALKEIQSALGLDYAGIDFGLSPDGNLLLFETNATMVIAKPKDDPRWTYRRAAIDGAIDAMVTMLKRRAAREAR